MTMQDLRWNRRTFLAAAGMATLGSVKAAAAPVPDDNVVKVSGGALKGVSTGTPHVTKWLGIPYAEPPVGPLRWQAPVPARPWAGIREASTYSASPWAPPASPKSVYYHAIERMDEDCLTLNVWAPSCPGPPRAVMVWIFGGAFVGGSSDHPLYDGEQLAAQDVVFVSINYRVGIFGFYSHPELSRESPDGVSGNYGLLDQIAALRWIRENIGAFGGDPGNVTIMGQSAGGFSVGFHLVMPESRGLFHRAIAQSGAPMAAPSSFILLGERTPMEAAGLDFAREVKATSLSDLRKLPPAMLVEANNKDWRFYPQIDGRHIPDHPFSLISSGKHAAVPVIVGRNRDEGTMFPPLGGGSATALQADIDGIYGSEASAARNAFAATSDAEARLQGQRAFADIVFNWNAAALAAVLAESGKSPVYSYHFEALGAVPADAAFEEGSGADLGTFHGSEIGFALCTQAARGFSMGATQHRLTKRMSRWWLQFARSGTPNGNGPDTWPRYRLGQATTFHIGTDGEKAGDIGDRERLEILGRAIRNRIVERI
jgi:para-nitrobenzyl esterase